MDSGFRLQAGSLDGALNQQHHVLLKHVSGGVDLGGMDMHSRVRVIILAISALVIVVLLAVRRLVTGIPFFPPKDYRSFTIYNRYDFLNLYSEDQLPSKAPIERLEGTRLGWAWAQCLCLIALVVVDGVLLAARTMSGQNAIEEVVEFCFWVVVLALALFRFYPTPYRPSCYAALSIFSLVPLVLAIQRDLWPIILVNPDADKLNDARHGWGVYARIALSAAVPLCALFTPREWYPVDPYSDDKASPEQTASMFSYMGSYSWIESLIKISLFQKRDITVEDLPTLPDYDKSRLWSRKVIHNQKATTFKTLLSLMRWDMLWMVIMSILTGSSQFIWPLSMRELLAYVEKSKPQLITPWIWVLGLFIGPMIVSWTWEGYVFTATRLIVRVKAAFTQNILEKTLRIRFSHENNEKSEKDKKDAKPSKEDENKRASDKSKVGMINNLMSTDLDQLTNAREFFLIVGSVPIEIIFSVVFLYNLLGWSSLVGVALMLVTMVVPVVLARLVAKIQKKLRLATDARIGLMSETLTSIRIVKFFGLESAFAAKIREKREKELALCLKSVMYNLSFHTISSMLPIINMIVTFGLYTKVQKLPLTASVAFTSISLFDILRSQFGWVAFVTQQVLYAFVSFERIDNFLNKEEELEDLTVDHSATEAQRGPYFKDATLAWEVPGSETDNNFRLSNVGVECPYGELTVVAGPVGSGKTSFLLGLLGEMRLQQGEVHLPRKSGIAYVAQMPWLQNETIKDNILFGSPYDEARYNMVVEACGLLTDLDNLDAGDETEVGERGVTLSGGQKARISLARAVYSPTQTLLLDDILSALDAGTSKLVVEKCIKGPILKGRTTVLVTHHVALVSSAAKKIVTLDDGNVISDCAPENMSEDAIQVLDNAETQLANKADQKAESLKNDIIDTPHPTGEPATKPVAPKKASGKLITDETTEKGRVDMSLIFDYLKNFGGPLVMVLLFGLSVSNQLGSLMQGYYIGFWSDQYTTDPDNVNVDLWLGVYGAVLIGTSLLNTFAYGVWWFYQWVAARRIHEKLINSVLHSPIRFFDTTPMGRIINRLSNDMKSIDFKLGASFMQVLQACLDIGFRTIVMSGLIPAFLVPTIVVSIIGILCGSVYVRAQIGVKRIISIKESPLFSHFGDSISGIVTIRAFGCQQRFLDESVKRVDEFSQPNEAFFALNRWIGVRIAACNSIIGIVAGIIAVTSQNKYTPGLIGFSMSNALAFSMSILMSVRFFNMLEIEMNSWERVSEYTNLEQEAEFTTDNEPPAAWPTEGNLEVRDLSVKYSEDGPDVLHKISFDVKPRERIGVVGRTGAGKSSLALSLLRFTRISNGSITINGLDTQKINLESLRRRITIIPQDPILFSGTIRTNLDPFGELDDTELQAALEGSGLAGTKPGLDSGIGSLATSGTTTPVEGVVVGSTKKIDLDTPVTAGGNNLSQGQRQLLAFARALVRRSKLLILDEATSSTDMKTDDMIQKTIRMSFPDSSLVCIAHRLSTVINFDRILVLDNLGQGGEVVEFDTPLNLLQKEDGVLRHLAKESGDFEKLLGIASTKSGQNGGA